MCQSVCQLVCQCVCQHLVHAFFFFFSIRLQDLVTAAPKVWHEVPNFGGTVYFVNLFSILSGCDCNTVIKPRHGVCKDTRHDPIINSWLKWNHCVCVFLILQIVAAMVLLHPVPTMPRKVMEYAKTAEKTLLAINVKCAWTISTVILTTQIPMGPTAIRV